MPTIAILTLIYGMICMLIKLVEPIVYYLATKESKK